MKKLKGCIVMLMVLTTLFCMAAVFTAGSIDAGAVPGDTDGEGWHTHDWIYFWDGGIYAVCFQCDTQAYVSLNTSREYSYCPGTELPYKDWITEHEWTVNVSSPEGYSSSGGRLAPYHFVYSSMDADRDYWQEGIPSNPGSYKVAIALDPYVGVDDPYGDYGRYKEHVTVRIGHKSGNTWTAEGQSLCLCCPDCGSAVAKVTLSDGAEKSGCTDKTVSPDVTTWFYDEKTEAAVTLPNYTVLYKGKGSTKYPVSSVQPTEAGTYSMYLAILSDPGNPNSATAKTTPVDFTVKPHSWTYYTYDYSLYAACSDCGEHGEVTINTSTVYEASRTYRGGTLDYEVFYEKNWSCQEGIEPYSVLFSGTETVSETSSTLYDHAFVKPRTTGNYNVRIALLKDQDDPDTAWISTKEKVYYLADISVGECEVLTYGPTQIAQFKEPRQEDGYYQVGTVSELLWCLSKKNLDADISLTNDIVVNPITVTKNGQIRSASYQIYKWSGFGTEKSAYTGNIIGNGYTIYGLYQPDPSVRFSGFVFNGKNCHISGLTIENSVLYGSDVAAIAGHYDHNSSDDDKILHCQSLNCYFNGSSTCAGIIALLTTSKTGSVEVEYCGNDSIIGGAAANGAGGIVGRAEGLDVLYLMSCYNLGPVTSEKGKAGGIIGQADLATSNALIAVWDCFNTGSVSCPNYVGGIAGYLKDYNGSSALFFDNCTSTGYLSSSSSSGGIAGYIDTKEIWDRRTPAYGNFYFNAKTGYKTADPSIDLEGHAEKMTREQANGNFICRNYRHTPCSHWATTASANCTKDGELVLKCAVCGATMEMETIKAYGHRFEYGECAYCGAVEDDEEDNLSGTVWGESPMCIIVSAAGVLILVMAGWLIINRRTRGKNKD